MSEILHAFVPALVAGVHGIGGGVWIGAVAFNLYVLTPRARTFFAEHAEHAQHAQHGSPLHEDFVFSVVHGLRWPVLAGALAVVGTGLVRARSTLAGASPTWTALMGLKLACAIVSLALFAFVTLRLWPRRVFATERELPVVRRRFAAVGTGIVIANLTAAALGVLASELR